jgi:hypothetical protein
LPALVLLRKPLYGLANRRLQPKRYVKVAQKMNLGYNKYMGFFLPHKYSSLRAVLALGFYPKEGKKDKEIIILVPDNFL